MNFEAVIFDCDGVLVDSEWASAEAWKATLASLGFDLSVEEFIRFIGTTDQDLANTFAERLGVTPDDLLAQAELEMRRVLAGGLEAFSDTLRLLNRLDGTHVAVASNSDRWRLGCVLGAAGLGDRFEVSVSADEVRAPKPDPGVYLRAAELLGVEPEQCLVIEDSPTGIAAARAAGMAVVAVDRGHFERHRLEIAQEVVTTLDDVVID